MNLNNEPESERSSMFDQIAGSHVQEADLPNDLPIGSDVHAIIQEAGSTLDAAVTAMCAKDLSWLKNRNLLPKQFRGNRVNENEPNSLSGLPDRSLMERRIAGIGKIKLSMRRSEA